MTLSDVRTLALALPEATEEPHHHLTSFRVRGKIFATADPKDTFLRLFVGEEVREPALTFHPECLDKVVWGSKVVGVQADLPASDPKLIEELLKSAWAAKAPPEITGKKEDK